MSSNPLPGVGVKSNSNILRRNVPSTDKSPDISTFP